MLPSLCPRLNTCPAPDSRPWAPSPNTPLPVGQSVCPRPPNPVPSRPAQPTFPLGTLTCSSSTSATGNFCSRAHNPHRTDLAVKSSYSAGCTGSFLCLTGQHVQLFSRPRPLRLRSVGAPGPDCPDRRLWKKPVLRLIGVNGPLHPLRGEPQFSLLHIHVSVGALTSALLEDRALLPRPSDCPLLRVC